MELIKEFKNQYSIQEESFAILFMVIFLLSVAMLPSASASTLFEYWFDEELGNKIIDYSGNNYNASIYNSPVRGYVSNSGLRGVTFNNGKTNQYAMTLHNNDFNVSDLTIETYQIVSSSQYAGYNRYIDKTGSYVFSMNTSSRALYLNNGSVASNTKNNVISFNKLEFIAVSYNSSSCNAKFYLNGALVQTVNKCIPLKNSSGNIFISNNKDLTRPSNGSVFWLKLSNTVLSDDQILNDYVNVSLMNNYMNISKRQTDLVFKGNLGRGWFSTNSSAIKADGSSIIITDTNTSEGPAIRVKYTYWGDEYWINSTVSVTSGHYAMLLFRNLTTSKYIQVSLNWNSSGKQDRAIGLNKNGVWSNNGYYPAGFSFPTKVNWRLFSNGSTEVYFNDKLYLGNYTQWIDLSNYDHFELMSGTTTTGIYKIYNFSSVNFFLVPQKTDVYPWYVSNPDTDGYSWVYTTAVRNWTQGFYPASLWWAASKHNTTRNRKIAEAWTDKYLSEFAFQDIHDQGFLALPFTEGIKHNNKSAWYNKAIDMADRLVNVQYNRVIKAIPLSSRDDTVIIDSIMNLMLLDWAYSKTGNKTYLNVMKNSTSTLITNHVKKSGAYWQDVDFYLSNGTAYKWYNTQAIRNETWARGNGWAIYGLTHMYNTDPTDVNKNTIINLSNYLVTKAGTFSDYVFYNTIENPTSSQDTSGASLIAAGLYKAYSITGNTTYKSTADKIRTNLSKKYLKNDGRLVNGSYSESQRKTELIFGDYYMGILMDEKDPQPLVSIPSFTVVSPNGGENWARGTTQTIRWNYTGSIGSRVKIELMKGGVLNRVVNSNAPVGSSGSGSYNWLINSTQTLGTNYKVRIVSTTNSAYTDTSNNNFTISAPGITVVSPNGGENWARGTTRTITWGSSGSPGAYVKIELLKAGVLNRVISSSTANDGSFSWAILSTQTLGSDYKIRITSTTNSAYTDTSNNNFIISMGTGITVTSPNGGENWARGTTRTISWTSSGSPGAYVKIELLKAGVLNRVISSSTANDGSFSWAILSTQTLGSDYKIRITSTANSAYTDTSNNNFIISSGTGITVTSPNGGENWIRGTTKTITWSSSGSPGAYVKIELLKGGILNRTINSITPNDGSFGWAIPSTQTLGSNYKIRVTSTTNSAYTDTSNNNFTISSLTPSITVVSPNGGETWARGTTRTITWSSSGSPGAYIKIELLKGGILNRTINSSTANDGSFGWAIPSTQTLGSNYKVRITSTANSAYTDTSNNNFAIS